MRIILGLREVSATHSKDKARVERNMQVYSRTRKVSEEVYNYIYMKSKTILFLS